MISAAALPEMAYGEILLASASGALRMTCEDQAEK